MNLTQVRLNTARVSAVMPTIAPQIMPANVVSDWFTDLANSMSDSFANARVEIVKQLAKSALPSPDELQSNWYMLALGGTYGLATKLVMLVLMLVALVMILTPLSNHSLRVRRTAQSFIAVGVFGALFFPLYTLLYNLVGAVNQGQVNIALGKQSSSFDDAVQAMLAVVMPSDVWFKVFVSFLGMILAYSAFGLALLNSLMVAVTGLFYPLAQALRPVSDKFNTMFHGANSALVTTLVTPILIVFGFLLPTYAGKILPGIATTGIAAGIFTIIGAAVAFLGPIGVAVFAFKSSSRVFGQMDFASISGSIGIDSMPPVTSRDMDDSIKQSGFKAFTSSFIPGAATANLGSSDNLLGDLKSLAVEGVSAAAAATGHPWVAGALNAADTTLTKEKRAHQTDQSHLSQQVPAQTQTAPPPESSIRQPVNESPVKEWPKGR